MANFDPLTPAIALDADEVEASDVIETVRAAWGAPPLDEDALWSRIAPALGDQAPPRRGWLLALLAGGFASTPRVVALGSAAAALAIGMVVVSSLVRGGSTASADVLRAADQLSLTARAALGDSSLTSEEAAAIRAQAAKLAQLLSQDQDALSELSSEDLDRVSTELGNVLVHFEDVHEGDQHEVEDTRLSIFDAHDAFEGERDRREREREHDGGDDRTATPATSTFTENSGSSGSSGSSGAASNPPTATSGAIVPSTPLAPVPSSTSGGDDGEGEDEHRETSPSPTPTASATKTPTPSTSQTSTPAATVTATSTPSSATSGAGNATLPGVAGSYTWSVGSAGTVTFHFDGHETLEVTGVNAASGWTASILEADGSEVRVRFSTSGGTATFEAKREDARLEITVSGGAGG